MLRYMSRAAYDSRFRCLDDDMPMSFAHKYCLYLSLKFSCCRLALLRRRAAAICKWARRRLKFHSPAADAMIAIEWGQEIRRCRFRDIAIP